MRFFKPLLVLIFSVLLLTGFTHSLKQVNAQTHPIAKPLAENPELEEKVMDIAKDLRCLVCQNETIAGSHADLAIDLRQKIKEQLEAGKSKAEIIQYMVDRYGDFVLFKPPFKTSTLLLWCGPFLLVLYGMWILLSYIRKKGRYETIENFSVQDLSHARSILEAQQANSKENR